MHMYNKENLAKIKKMNGLAPGLMTAFWAFDRAAVADGAIPVKYKELIAVAVALTTQCPYCIDIHSGNARKAGATDAEIVEAAMIAAARRAGAAVTHATLLFVARTVSRPGSQLPIVAFHCTAVVPCNFRWLSRPVSGSSHTMNKRHQLSRRHFLKTSIASLTTLTIVPRYVLGGAGFTPPSE